LTFRRAKSFAQGNKSLGEQWIGWLPPGKAETFASLAAVLRADSGMLGVALNEGIELSRRGSPSPCSELGIVCAELFGRLAGRLEAALRCLYRHSSNLTLLPRVSPLNADFFRSEPAKRRAKRGRLFANVLLTSNSRFSHKLEDLTCIVCDLAASLRPLAVQMQQASAAHLPVAWEQLEVLDYDLNTCLAETLVVLKSFFHVLPDADTPGFRRQIEAALSAPKPPSVVLPACPDLAPPLRSNQRDLANLRRRRNSSA